MAFSILGLLGIVSTFASALTHDVRDLTPQPLILEFSASSGGKAIVTTGDLVTDQDVTTYQPALSAPSLKDQGPFVALMLDVSSGGDANNNTLHWLESDVYTSEQMSPSSKEQVVIRDVAPANYMNPALWPCSRASHKYSVMLFRQPDQWAIPSAYESYMTGVSDRDVREHVTRVASCSASSASPDVVEKRGGFPVGSFAKTAGLGVPVASSWFELKLDSSAYGSNACECEKLAKRSDATTDRDGDAPVTTAPASLEKRKKKGNKGDSNNTSNSTTTATGGAMPTALNAAGLAAAGFAVGLLV